MLNWRTRQRERPAAPVCERFEALKFHVQNQRPKMCPVSSQSLSTAAAENPIAVLRNGTATMSSRLEARKSIARRANFKHDFQAGPAARILKEAASFLAEHLRLALRAPSNGAMMVPFGRT